MTPGKGYCTFLISKTKQAQLDEKIYVSIFHFLMFHFFSTLFNIVQHKYVIN